MIGAQFSDEDFETLSDWLGRRGKGITDIVELEGFLTAIVIAPNTLSPLTWLPKSGEESIRTSKISRT